MPKLFQLFQQTQISIKLYVLMSKFNVYEKDFLWIILALFENFETKHTQNRTQK